MSWGWYQPTTSKLIVKNRGKLSLKKGAKWWKKILSGYACLIGGTKYPHCHCIVLIGCGRQVRKLMILADRELTAAWEFSCCWRINILMSFSDCFAVYITLESQMLCVVVGQSVMTSFQLLILLLLLLSFHLCWGGWLFCIFCILWDSHTPKSPVNFFLIFQGVANCSLEVVEIGVKGISM